MTLIEGIGDEVVQFFIGLLFVCIVALAWCTTNTSNDGTYRTVFLLDRRRLRAVRRLITHTESTTIAEGTTIDNSEEIQSNSTIEEDKSPPSTSTDTSGNESPRTTGEETRIVEAMDAPNSIGTNGVRRRIPLNQSLDQSSSQPECDETEHEASGNCCICGDTLEHSEPEIKSSDSRIGEGDQDNDKICVKLKFVTDELRQVDGSLRENIGDFKRRHFQVEFAANKVVKLIFNGQILQREEETLQSCGFFDNCVVHCVLLPASINSSQGTTSGTRDVSIGTDNHQTEWHLENYLLAILCCFLGAAWYLRCVYSHLYTVTATIGLILMTGIFTIIMFGVHFPDNADLNQQRSDNLRSRQ